MKNGFGDALLFFLCGTALYPSLEILYRGYTHPAMALAGGVSALLLYGLHHLYAALPLLVRAVIGGGIVTVVEFIFGVIFNLFWGLAIWDYSELPLQLMGQICFSYFLLWCVLSLAVGLAVHRLDKEWEEISV